MSDFDLAEQLNNEGMRLRDDGDIAGAEAAYRAAGAAAPDWSAPVYNLGLLYKYEGRWRESLACYQHAVILAPESILSSTRYSYLFHQDFEPSLSNSPQRNRTHSLPLKRVPPTTVGPRRIGAL
jgi:tetratricopeptide (TPR) repeat protein